MGYPWCENCNAPKTDDAYGCCDKEGWATWCERCYLSEPRETCAECKEEFCEKHGILEIYSCCGNYFCGESVGCFSKHKISKREECGHVVCNYQIGECAVCDAETDIERVKELMENCKSSSLKKYLEQWLEESEKVKKIKNGEEESSRSQEEESEEKESPSEEEEKREGPKKKAKTSNAPEIIVIDD